MFTLYLSGEFKYNYTNLIRYIFLPDDALRYLVDIFVDN